MPRNIIGNAPFPPILLFDENRDFNLSDLKQIAEERMQGASICVRYPEGPTNRGGYFFHFAPNASEVDTFELYDFEKRPVGIFSAAALVAFVNHCTGRKFDKPSFILCQTKLNFLKDKEPDA